MTDSLNEDEARKLARFAEHCLQGSSIPLEDWNWILERVRRSWDYHTGINGVIAVTDPNLERWLIEIGNALRLESNCHCCGEAYFYDVSSNMNGYYFSYYWHD